MKQAIPRCKYFIITNVFVSCLSLLPAGRAARADDLASDPQTDAAGNYHALVIGIKAYQNIQRLKTAEDDAKEVEAILRKQYGLQTKLLLNANRQQIISALNAYRRELPPDSNLLIYYAGHGINDREIDKAYGGRGMARCHASHAPRAVRPETRIRTAALRHDDQRDE